MASRDGTSTVQGSSGKTRPRASALRPPEQTGRTDRKGTEVATLLNRMGAEASALPLPEC